MIPRDPATRRQLKLGLLFASPVLLGFVLFTLYPLLANVYPGGENPAGPEFNRLESMRVSLLGGLGAAWWNTLVFAGISVPLTIFVALALALLLNLPVRGKRFYQAVFFLPSLVPAAASALVWQWFFPWHGGLTQPGRIDTKYVLILASVWAAGGNMILYRVAMRGIPRDLYDAADTEGANWWQRTTRVTLPALAPVLFFTLLVGVVGAFQIFAWPYVLLQTGRQNHPDIFDTADWPSGGRTLFLLSALCTAAVLLAGKRFLHTDEQ